MVKRSDFPEPGELVVGTVKEVKGFGAFVSLDEYPGKEGFIHIAEVASGWVKYVRDHVREKQRVVCKVLNIDPSKGHIDLSLKRVNERQKRETVAAWKNEQKAEKLFEILAKSLGRQPDDAYREFGLALADAYGSLYTAFEAAVLDAEAFAKEHDPAWARPFAELAAENIAIPFVEIAGELRLVCAAPDGIDHIKEALVATQETEFEDVTITVRYLGAPRYRLKVRAPDYKVAEEEIRKAAERATNIIAATGGEASFVREGEAAKA